jgi:hypothetical protein
MNRFVILAHDWPEPHFDLLLEAGAVLRAWRLRGEPGAAAVPAEPNADHRTLYLDYEGPVSGDRGTVSRWDAGTFDWIVDGACAVLEFHGTRLTGLFVLGAGRFGPSS